MTAMVGRPCNNLSLDARLLPTIDATPIADAERHNLDRGQIVVDGNVLIVGVHDRRRPRPEDHGWRVGIAVEEARIRGALTAADLGLAAGHLLVVLGDGL